MSLSVVLRCAFVFVMCACNAGKRATPDDVPVAPREHRANDAAIADAAPQPDAGAAARPDAAIATRRSAKWPRLGQAGFEGLSIEAVSSPESIERAFPGTRVEHPSPYELMVYAGTKQLMLVRLSETEPNLAYMIDVNGRGIQTTDGIEVGQPLARVLRLSGSRLCETALDPTPTTDRHRIYCWIDRHLSHGAMVRGELPPQAGPELDAWIRAHSPTIQSIGWDREGYP